MQDFVAAVRAALLTWYDREARDLPWRRTRDPYRVWVSEVMLQQTRVETVVRYYDRFLERFPSAEALADAPEDDVMAAWSGLGYYRRARMLHAGVREVVARYGGAVPKEADARRSLPGVGRYTAGAIGSIAFDREEPIVDGNVARVLSRLLALEPGNEPAALARAQWTWAERLVKGERPGALNQALMELGATACRPSRPRCDVCPLRAHCSAHAQGRTAELPVTRPKPVPRPVSLVALLATRGDASRAIAPAELWLERGNGSLFGGLWNLPLSEGRGIRAAEQLMTSRRLRGALVQQSVGEIEHVLTHRRMQVELFRVHGADVSDPEAAALRAVALDQLSALGVSRLTLKAVALLAPDRKGRLSAARTRTKSAPSPSPRRTRP